MPRIKDLTGLKNGKLVVTGLSHIDDNGRSHWFCECACGKVITRKGQIITEAIKKDKKSHCGCSPPLKTHGLTNSNKKLHWVWAAMLQRCRNPKSKDYKDYGARGITVCESWHEFENFYNWALSSGYKHGLTIDRIDTNGQYEPENCQWTDLKQQMNNQRRTIIIEWKGVRKPLTQWAEEVGINYRTLKARIKTYKWDIDRAMTEPARLGKNQHG